MRDNAALASRLFVHLCFEILEVRLKGQSKGAHHFLACSGHFGTCDGFRAERCADRDDHLGRTSARLASQTAMCVLAAQI